MEGIKGLGEGNIFCFFNYFKGTGSLIKHTMVGAFGSVSKMSDAFGNGVAVLCGDDDFMIQRARL